jgi:hypothetical protein
MTVLCARLGEDNVTRSSEECAAVHQLHLTVGPAWPLSPGTTRILER